MNANRPDFSFDLTRNELLWLCGVLGITALPLPSSSFLVVPAEELSECQLAGAASLQRRGLLRAQSDDNWQIERLLEAILRELAAAEGCLRLQYCGRGENPRVLHFFADEMRFSLDLDGGIARFCLFSGPEPAAEALWGWLALPPDLSPGRGEFLLPQPFDFLPAAWRDPDLAARILSEHGLPAGRIPAALEWVASLDWAAAVTLRERRSGQWTTALRFVSCGDRASLWGGFEAERLTALSGLSLPDLQAALAELP